MNIEQIENFRRHRKLSLRKASLEIGISPTTLSKIERGHIPDRQTIYKLASWTGSDISVLYKNLDLLIEE